MNWETRLLNEVERNQHELISLCSSLLQIPSENPPGDSREISRFIIDYLQDYGIDTQIYESRKNMWNLISSIGETEANRHLIFCGHTDVVPAGDRDKWDFPPFSGHVDQGFIHGRGASDMKCGLAGIIFTACLFQRLGVPINGQLSLLIVPDEETGGEFGVPWVFDQNLIHGSAAVIAEPSESNHPTIGQKGSCWFEVTIKGTPGHGSLSPLVGDSAILKAVKAIEALRKIWNIQVKLPDEVKEIISISKKARDAKVADVFDHVTINVGTIQGGTKSNVVADRTTFQVDTRLPFGISPDEVLAEAKRILNDAGIEAEVRPFGFQGEANWTPPTSDIVSLLVDSITNITGKEAYGVLQWASSDARYFRRQGIPVLQYGPAELSGIHAFNERAPINQIIQATKVYALTAYRYLKDDGKGGDV